jgi:hypothetical protein
MSPAAVQGDTSPRQDEGLFGIAKRTNHKETAHLTMRESLQECVRLTPDEVVAHRKEQRHQFCHCPCQGRYITWSNPARGNWSLCREDGARACH